ncbi:MAG: HAD family phosphatase [Oceanospirillaceae bacterium]
MNIIFDLGGVVFDWVPDAFIESVYDNPVVRELVKKELLQHSDWVELDRGTLDKSSAIKRCAQRSGLFESQVAPLLDALPDALLPKLDTVKLIEDLAHMGHHLYVLSNMHSAAKEHLLHHYDFWHHFKGKVFSCDIQQVKPDAIIFEHILATYKLDPQQSIFIDDMYENVEAAARFGITPLLFKSPAQCKEELVKLNCLLLH